MGKKKKQKIPKSEPVNSDDNPSSDPLEDEDQEPITIEGIPTAKFCRRCGYHTGNIKQTTCACKNELTTAY